MTDADQAAVLRVIHDTHSKALLRYVLSLTHGDMPFAEDVVQESLLRLWRKPDMLQQPSDGIRAWLFTVARNQVIDDRRSARYARELRTAEMPEQASPDAIGPACDKWILSDALMSLATIIASRWCAPTTSAKPWPTSPLHEHIPEGTVKSRLHYALRALRKCCRKRVVVC